MAEGNGASGRALQWGSLAMSLLALTFAAGAQWGGRDAPLITKVDINAQRLDNQAKLIDQLERLAGENSVRVERLVEQFSGFKVTRELILGEWIKRQEAHGVQLEELRRDLHAVENLARHGPATGPR